MKLTILPYSIHQPLNLHPPFRLPQILPPPHPDYHTLSTLFPSTPLVRPEGKPVTKGPQLEGLHPPERRHMSAAYLARPFASRSPTPLSISPVIIKSLPRTLYSHLKLHPSASALYHPSSA